MASGNMKGFYRQKKNRSRGGISKRSPKPKNSSPNHVAAVASHVNQPTALISRASPDHQDEDVLRQFDLNMAYGPCIGMTRLARWERAQRLGLNPLTEIEGLLKKDGKVSSGCLWDDRRI